jgi:hypothetical protein
MIAANADADDGQDHKQGTSGRADPVPALIPDAGRSLASEDVRSPRSAPDAPSVL